MKQFLLVKNNITRCTYTNGEEIKNSSLFIYEDKKNGTPTNKCPINVVSVNFIPRDIYKYVFKNSVEARESYDGVKFDKEIDKKVFNRTAYRAVLEIVFDNDELIYGLGQDEYGEIEKRGKIEYLYQHNMRIPIPMFVSSKGYGVLFNCTSLMVFDDTGKTCKITLECVDQLDFYVIKGSVDEIIAGYRYLTGKASLMPNWVMGYWQSKERYKTQTELVETAKKYRELGIPLDVIVQDWLTWKEKFWGDKHFDKDRYPNFSKAMQELHNLNTRCVFSIWPNMATGCRNHQEFMEKGLLLGNDSTYDAFNADARSLYWKQAEEEIYSAGVDGWWCDSTEPFADVDWTTPDKAPEEERYALVGGEHEKFIDPMVANAFSLMHAKGIYENQPKTPVVNLTRAGWAGIQKYGVILWAGDTSATWKELKSEIAKGINISISGIPYWTVDAGAFFLTTGAHLWFLRGEYPKGVNDKGYQELYTRWLQFACFLPVFRSHGTDTPREVWNFNEPFRSAIENAIKLRYRLMPYIKEAYRKIHENDYTLMRGFLFDFPNDKKAITISNEYMFGSDILVCPIYEPQLYGANSVEINNPKPMRECYLPSGCDWYDFYTNKYYHGGQTINIETVIDRIPIFIKAGATIPVTDDAIEYADANYTVKNLHFPKKEA